jgi:hypothetical protein
MKIYVASSWRNERQQSVVEALRRAGHEVYDFKHPAEGDNGFHWSDVDPDWQNWTPEKYVEKLNHPIAESGFCKDFDAMKWADCCVVVLPCGRSAHSEAGWMKGQGKPTIILLDKMEPELMYKMFDKIACTLLEVLEYVGELRAVAV